MVNANNTKTDGTKISVQDLDFFYGKVQALFGITMDIAPRQVTALIGPSGCGKSTFIKTLNRMNDIIEGARVNGKVLIDGENIYEQLVDGKLITTKFNADIIKSELKSILEVYTVKHDWGNWDGIVGNIPEHIRREARFKQLLEQQDGSENSETNNQ